MTTILNLPDEILRMIFESQLYFEEVAQCQIVCRAWYLPAHIVLLKDIQLESFEHADSFIASIDHNPNPLYLKAVKNITLNTWGSDNRESSTPCNKEKFNKLFFRFPNLEELAIHDSSEFVESFDDEICKTFLEKYPKLKFEADLDLDIEGTTKYDDLMYKVRLLATKIHTNGFSNVVRHGGGLAQCLIQFTRLQTIYASRSFDSFQTWLPLFENLSSLTEVRAATSVDETNYFMERYLGTKSEETQNLIVKNLLNINTLYWDNDEGFCLNGIKFIAKYMTGLNIALEFFRSVNESLLTVQLSPSVLTEYLPTIVTSVFHRTAAIPKDAPNRVFIVELKNVGQLITEIEKDQTTLLQFIRINVNDRYISALNLFNPGLSLDDVDEFKLRTEERSRSQISLDFYTKIIDVMPSLKKLDFDILAQVTPRRPNDAALKTYPQAKDLILRATAEAKLQDLLDEYSYIFPKLERLHIYYNSGTWKRSIGDFQLELGDYSLEKLVLDVTPVKRKMSKHSDLSYGVPANFFLVEVSLLQQSKRYLYKVQLDDIKCATRVTDAQVEGPTRKHNYYRVYIIAYNLQNLELAICQEEEHNLEYENYLEYESYVEYEDMKRSMRSVTLKLE